MDGLTFGVVDNAVLIFGAYTGCEIERYIGGRGRVGGILGAAIGNTVSDGLGAVLDPALQPMLLGVVLGTLLPIVTIPVVEWMRGAQEK
jgi:hypothetical protein